MQFAIVYIDAKGVKVIEAMGSDLWRATRRQIQLAQHRLALLKAGREEVPGPPYLVVVD